MAWQYEEDWVDWVNTRLRWQDRLIVADLGVGKGHTRAMNEQRREEIYRGHKDNPTSKDRKQRTDNIHQCQHERSSKSEMSNQLTLLWYPREMESGANRTLFAAGPSTRVWPVRRPGS